MTDSQVHDVAPTQLIPQSIQGLGLPAFWMPSKGPLSAGGLIFRVGRGTEPMALSGITHMIRHTVGLSLGLDPHEFEDTSDVDITGFTQVGSAEEIVNFLSDVSWTLTSLPIEHIDEARNIVRNEHPDRTHTARSQVLALRHGLRGRGAEALDEYGIRKSGHRQVITWADTNFHQANAALWITTPQVENINIRLRSGAATPPAYTPVYAPTPGAEYGQTGQVALSFLVPATPAGHAMAHMAKLRIQSQLLNEGSASHIDFGIKDIGDDLCEVVISSDCAINGDDRVSRSMINTLDALAGGSATEQEFDAYCKETVDRVSDPANGAILTRAYAVAALQGYRIEPASSNDFASITPETIATSAQMALNTMLMVAAPNCLVLVERFQLISGWNCKPISGSSIKPIRQANEDRHPKRELTISPNAISLKVNSVTQSMRFSECGVMLVQASEGYRELISENGSRIVIRSAEWEYGNELVARLDREIAPENRVVLDSYSATNTSVERRINDR